MQTSTHWSDPARGTQEYMINRGLERDGIRQRVCLHADRTITPQPDGAPDVVSCDYCGAVHTAVPGIRADMPTTYWSPS